MATRTKQPGGIVTRHSRSCASREGGRCNCDPSYEAWISSRREKRRIRKTFSVAEYGKDNLRVAKGWLLDAQRAQRTGTLRAPSRETVEQVGAEWLEKAKAGQVLSRKRTPYKRSALVGYEGDLSRYVYPELGYLRLSELRRDDVQMLVDKLVGEGLSGQTVLNIIVPLRSIVRYAQTRKGLETNPTMNLEVPEAGARRERAETPTGAAALLDALADDERPIYATAFYAGLRRGELRALRTRNVLNLDGEGVASIRVETAWDDRDGDIAPKSKAGVREVPVPETLRQILAEHVERTGRSGDDFLLGHTAGAPFVPNTVRRNADKAWAAAAVGAFLTGGASTGGIELVPIGLHECRHTYSSFLDAAGISETRADRYMGHSNRSVQSRYRHQLAGQLAEDAATLEAYLTGARSGKFVSLATAV